MDENLTKNNQPTDMVSEKSDNIDYQTNSGEISENKNKFPLTGTLILIVFLAFLTAFFLFLAIYRSTKKPESLITKTNVPTPTPFAQSVLTLAVDNSSTTSAHAIDVNINSGNNQVTAVQLELAFDQRAIKNIQITKGNFFPTATELLNNIDYSDGRLTYALGILPNSKPVNGVGTVIKITYSINPTATTSSTTFTLLPKSEVSSAGIIQSTLKSVNDLTIPLSPQPNTATQSSR